MAVLGLDFGNVLKLSGERTLNKGAAEGVAKLREVFEDQIYVVSRVDDEVQELEVGGFIQAHFDQLQIPSKRVFFCLKRSDKGAIVDRLKITHFLDDRTEVLSHMHTVPHRYAMNPTPEQLRDFPPDNITVVKDWEEATRLICSSFQE